MKNLLLLCSKEGLHEPWCERIQGRASWLDRAPESLDLGSTTMVIEAFHEREEKVKALVALGEKDAWTGTVASLYDLDSVTRLARLSGLGPRLAGFYPSPGPGNTEGMEVLRGEDTSPQCLEQLQGLFEELGFTVFVCRDQVGGILPRVLVSLINEAAYMAWSGIAPVERIDTMMRLGANFPMGPFQWADRLGLDRILALLERLSQEMGPHYQPCPWIRRKVEAGKLGVKTGEGFYKYDREGQ